MRKIVASLFISLDGVVDSPQDWHFPYMNEEVMGAIADGMKADTIVLGRRTYEESAGSGPSGRATAGWLTTSMERPSSLPR